MTNNELVRYRRYVAIARKSGELKVASEAARNLNITLELYERGRTYEAINVMGEIVKKAGSPKK